MEHSPTWFRILIVCLSYIRMNWQYLILALVVLALFIAAGLHEGKHW
jgi:uncharacterized protein (DUF58 family)